MKCDQFKKPVDISGFDAPLIYYCTILSIHRTKLPTKPYRPAVFDKVIIPYKNRT